MSTMNYGTPKKLPDGRYYLKVSPSSDVQGRVMVQLNKVKLLTKFDESDEVTIELSQASVDRISSIDAENLGAAKQNSEVWFGKLMAEQTLDAAYTKSVQAGGRLNVPKATVKGSVVTKVYSHDRTVSESSILEADTVCDVILEFSGIWFMKKTFGAIWRIAQVRMLSPPKKVYPDEYLFQDADEAEAGGDAEENDDDYI